MSSDPISFHLLPQTSALVGNDELSIGNVSLIDIANQFGTPTFVYDEQHLIDRCEEAVAAFPDGVAYASKAFLCGEMARLAHGAGMYIDVATGGEMFVAMNAGVPADRLILHGNNKSDDELRNAMQMGVAKVVVDSFDELQRIEQLAPATPLPVMLRVTPGVEAHTHEFVLTGADDSKFGFNLANGDAQKAVELVGKSNFCSLVGIHMHIGSQIFETASFESAVKVIADFISSNRIEELCIGGGLGVAYVHNEYAPTISEWGSAARFALDACGLQGVRLTAEPGRSIAAPAAVTIYSVGTIKDVPGVRKYISVDGGMSDNPRPVLYGSGYEAFIANAVSAQRHMKATVVGKHCESGDFLVRDAQLPENTNVGNILCTPVTGAYGYSMASHYNRMLRPAVVFVRNGEAREVLRRETYNDLLRFEVQTK